MADDEADDSRVLCGGGVVGSGVVMGGWRRQKRAGRTYMGVGRGGAAAWINNRNSALVFALSLTCACAGKRNIKVP